MKLSFLQQDADGRWGCGGAAAPVDASGSAFRERQVSFYAEAGLARRWAALGTWAWKDARITGTDPYGTRSTADLQVGARFAVREGRTPVAVQGLISVPTYPASDLSAPPGARRQYLPAGSGRVEGELQLLAGRSLWPLPVYASGAIGYRARGGGFADAWLASLEVGAASRSLFGKVEVRAHRAVSDPCGAEAVGTVSAAERAVRLAPEAAFRVAGVVWVAGGVAVPLSGVNVLDAAQWSLGVLVWRRGG